MKVTLVPGLQSNETTECLSLERLSLQVILNFLLPSVVVTSNNFEKMLVAEEPIPFVPIPFLSSSLKLLPALSLVNAAIGIQVPSSVFLMGSPLPLSVTVILSSLTSMSILFENLPSVFTYSSRELSMISLMILRSASEYVSLLLLSRPSSSRTHSSFSDGSVAPM